MSTRAINRIAGWLIVAFAVLSIVLHVAACVATGAEQAITGTVIRVKDGDTLVVRSGNTEQTIRLAEIDAPEKGQPGGLAARVFLEAQTIGKTVTVDSQGTDRYGRVIGHVAVGKVNVSERMVQMGHAWRYDAYSKSARLKELQLEAQTKKRGLWAAKEKPVAPWEWRKGTR